MLFFPWPRRGRCGYPHSDPFPSRSFLLHTGEGWSEEAGWRGEEKSSGWSGFIVVMLARVFAHMKGRIERKSRLFLVWGGDAAGVDSHIE